MKVFESQVAVVTNLVKGLDHSGPVGCAVQKGAEAFQRMIRTLLGKLLEVNVLDAFAELGDPVLGELEQHDVAGVEMNFQKFKINFILKKLNGQKEIFQNKNY